MIREPFENRENSGTEDKILCCLCPFFLPSFKVKVYMVSNTSVHTDNVEMKKQCNMHHIFILMLFGNQLIIQLVGK